MAPGHDPWPWPIAMAHCHGPWPWPEGWPPPFESNIKSILYLSRKGGRPPCESNIKSILYLTRKGGAPPSDSNIKSILYLTRRVAATLPAMAMGHGNGPWLWAMAMGHGQGPWPSITHHPSVSVHHPSSIIQQTFSKRQNLDSSNSDP